MDESDKSESEPRQGLYYAQPRVTEPWKRRRNPRQGHAKISARKNTTMVLTCYDFTEEGAGIVFWPVHCVHPIHLVHCWNTVCSFTGAMCCAICGFPGLAGKQSRPANRCFFCTKGFGLHSH